mgnify:CR=1 FL=1
MKKHGILNSDIASVLSYLGHTDQIIIADAGLPVPEHVLRIDLAVTPGLPSFLDVLDAVKADMYVEKIVVAEEIDQHNPEMASAIYSRFNNQEIAKVSHESFKDLSSNVKAIIRTGEITPYANIILQANVFFAEGAD